MIDYIKSESCKKYLIERNIKLEDKLIYALIINNRRYHTFEDIRNSIKDLAENTLDEEIKAQTEIWLKNHDKEVAAFTKDSGPEYLYIVKYYDRMSRHEEIHGYYRSLDLALKNGKLMAEDYELERFVIEKAYIESIDQESDSEKMLDYTGEAHFFANGELMFVNIRMSHEEIEDPIEDRYYIMPHPFRKGDIVKRIYDDKDERTLSVILSDDDDEMSYQKKRMERITSLEWNDTGIAVEDVDLKTGTIWDNDGHPLPYDYEYYPIDDHTDDIGERVMLNISDIVKGKIASYQYIQHGLMKLREEYDDSNTYNLLYGMRLKKSSIGYIFE